MNEGPGKIIHHNFGAPSAEEPPQSEERPDSAREMNRLIDMLSGATLIEKMDKFIATMKKIKDMRSYLRGLGAIATHETMALRKELLKGMTFDQMCDAVLNSDYTKWQINPSYYQAISEYFTHENLSYKEEQQPGSFGFTVVE